MSPLPCSVIRANITNWPLFFPNFVFQICSWWTDVNSFPALDNQTQFGPTYKYEYNTRQTYGANITGWGPNDPLNATWWHHVTEREFFVPIHWKECSLNQRGSSRNATESDIDHRECPPLLADWHFELTKQLAIQHVPGKDLCSQPALHGRLLEGEGLLHTERKRCNCEAELYSWVRLCAVDGRQ